MVTSSRCTDGELNIWFFQKKTKTAITFLQNTVDTNNLARINSYHTALLSENLFLFSSQTWKCFFFRFKTSLLVCLTENCYNLIKVLRVLLLFMLWFLSAYLQEKKDQNIKCIPNILAKILAKTLQCATCDRCVWGSREDL